MIKLSAASSSTETSATASYVGSSFTAFTVIVNACPLVLFDACASSAMSVIVTVPFASATGVNVSTRVSPLPDTDRSGTIV